MLDKSRTERIRQEAENLPKFAYIKEYRASRKRRRERNTHLKYIPRPTSIGTHVAGKNTLVCFRTITYFHRERQS